jgi:5-methylcytosine-specific restriction endonuclease McrA
MTEKQNLIVADPGTVEKDAHFLISDHDPSAPEILYNRTYDGKCIPGHISVSRVFNHEGVYFLPVKSLRKFLTDERVLQNRSSALANAGHFYQWMRNSGAHVPTEAIRRHSEFPSRCQLVLPVKQLSSLMLHERMGSGLRQTWIKLLKGIRDPGIRNWLVDEAEYIYFCQPHISDAVRGTAPIDESAQTKPTPVRVPLADPVLDSDADTSQRCRGSTASTPDASSPFCSGQAPTAADAWARSDGYSKSVDGDDGDGRDEHQDVTDGDGRKRHAETTATDQIVSALLQSLNPSNEQTMQLVLQLHEQQGETERSIARVRETHETERVRHTEETKRVIAIAHIREQGRNSRITDKRSATTDRLHNLERERTKRRKLNAGVRVEVAVLQGCKCNICKEPLDRCLEVDHIQPLHLGGADTLHNLQALCRDCQVRATVPVSPPSSRASHYVDICV